MTSKAEDKAEIVVQVESKDTSSKVILIMLIIVLVGLVIAVMMTGGPDALLSNDDDDRGVGNCGDGIDNDKGGQADRDDPDCYANPEVWEGYDPSRTEANRDNDPPGGRP